MKRKKGKRFVEKERRAFVKGFTSLENKKSIGVGEDSRAILILDERHLLLHLR